MADQQAQVVVGASRLGRELRPGLVGQEGCLRDGHFVASIEGICAWPGEEG